MFKKRRTDRAEPRFDREDPPRDISPIQAPQRKERPVFKLKGPPLSIRMVGMVGNLCVAVGLLGVVFGIILGLGGAGAGFLVAAWSLTAVIGGVFYIAAYHVAVAVLDMRDMAQANMDR